MAGVAQLVELQIVILAVAGSSPVARPTQTPHSVWRLLFYHYGGVSDTTVYL
jgi:hypothetical protein